jgi:hypothetical protein
MWMACLLLCYVVGAYRNLSILPELFAFFSALTLLTSLQLVYKAPYRLVGNMNEQIFPITLMGTTGTLHVDRISAEYFKSLQQVAIEAGWTRNTPLIDMTGATPGASVALDARILSQPWFFGGYPGSNVFAQAALNSVSTQTLSDAWVITAPQGQIRLNNQILSDVNLLFPFEYQLIGEFVTGYRNEKHYLWKPKFK